MYATSQAVCCLLGGSGRHQLFAVPEKKLPALCTSLANRNSVSYTSVILPVSLPMGA